MIEFKQIIGRGMRLYDGKDYFTIYDFVKAYEYFNDPEWDGEPIEPEPVEPRPERPKPGDPEPADPADEPQEPGEGPQPRKLKIKLADGKERKIQHMSATSYWSPDGKPMSGAQLVEQLFGELPELFRNEDEPRELWSKPETRKALLEGLEEKSYGTEQLREIGRLIDTETATCSTCLPTSPGRARRSAAPNA